ncbi:MAG: acetyl-CoA carboxylase biotin carboxyl carrier protein subunit [Bdellovibrionota bacterium]
MSKLKGRIGKWELTWKSPPRGAKGTAGVLVRNIEKGGEPAIIEVSWRRDSEGVWIDLPASVCGFDIDGYMTDEGRLVFDVRQRFSSHEWKNLFFARAGLEDAVLSQSSKKTEIKVKAQMPGKVIKLLMAPGASVDKDQPVLIMEAMKMENEIRAPHAGKLASIAVTHGQAIEIGAELFKIDLEG